VADAVLPSQSERKDIRLPLSRNQRAIASLMTTSASIPQFGLDVDVDVTYLAALREQEEATFSISDAVVRAAALSLRAHPVLNASFDEDSVVQHARVHVGLGIIGPDGTLADLLERPQGLAAG
jgi:pyruvate dehydrogenase E2 component (dihydrolipoamide acetyltransferase)